MARRRRRRRVLYPQPTHEAEALWKLVNLRCSGSRKAFRVVRERHDQKGVAGILVALYSR